MFLPGSFQFCFLINVNCVFIFVIPPVYTVKVHSFTTGRTCGADGEIREQMENVKWHTNEEITGCQECDIIIVFCPITSRVGSDVEAAMRKIPAGNQRFVSNSLLLLSD